MLKVLIAGGSGFIGRHLSRRIRESGGEVAIVTRSPNPSLPFQQITWDSLSNEEKSSKLVEGYDMIVNLSGAGIEKKWSEAYKKEMLESRIRSTSTIVKAINSSKERPKYFVNASAVGYYGDVEGKAVDEDSKPGDDYLANLCVSWEEEARKIDREVKLLIPRFGVILGRDGGAFPQLMRGINSGVSFNLKGRESWKSWVHIDDAISSIVFMTQIGFDGPYNVVSPNPLRMDGMMNILAMESGRKIRIRMGPAMANLLLGEGSKYSIFSGQKVVPKRLIDSGFNFKFPGISEALKDLLAEGEMKDAKESSVKGS
ncbi:MAG: TIGR01777 family oxidoreductase [Candidatus Thermoplasmatota archaeon]|jgi:uncharacterized protein (TIGR01777 family)|nr:TIGR01777 family oxidoreductase [Candidatus Thermoplasmatota archaeon]MCL5790001.1 TIGR01777 family oxidoreductase [Candidatus Thermoplasmatota archaeon]